jgi:hypothetical protein
MLIEQAPAPDDVSAIRMAPVPDPWPPAEPAMLAMLAMPTVPTEPAGASLPAPAPARVAESAVGRLGQPADGAQAWSRQFAVLLADALTGDRPARQVLPWLSERGRVHLQRLRPLFGDGQGARVQRVMTAQPSPNVVEMTLIVAIGPRIRALAVRLALAGQQRWICTDIEAA